MYCVYSLYNKQNNKIYIGQTNDINRRLVEHNTNTKHFTGKISGQWELFYQEEFIDRKTAMAREKQLKSYQGRKFLRSKLNK